ncbi:MAG: DUF2391 family protein [Nanoarchaeota archaeon]|nr:DUF2391 family protein [Nanoarchaeota archaeon]
MKIEPHHFTWNDFFKALLGSLVVGITFLFKGAMQTYALSMKYTNIILVITITLVVVSLEVYFLSYRFVVNRKARPFSEFWAKRFFAIVISSFAAIYLLMYVYGINHFLTHTEILKLSVAIFMPAAIAGAAVEILKKK